MRGDAEGFVAYVTTEPTHKVRVRRTGHHRKAEWSISPWEAGGAEAYQLTFKLPTTSKTGSATSRTTSVSALGASSVGGHGRVQVCGQLSPG